MGTPKIRVRDHMIPATHTFTADTSVQEIVDTLLKYRITGGPVIDENKSLIGYVTEQDCLKQMLEGSYYCEDHTIASDIMCTTPMSISPEDDIMKVAEMIVDLKPKQYPVVENSKLVGVITRSEVLKALSKVRSESCPS